MNYLNFLGQVLSIFSVRFLNYFWTTIVYQQQYRLMFSYWAENINEFKSHVSTEHKLLNQSRLALQEEQIDRFWDNCSLRQMESMFTILNEHVLNYLVSQVLQPYLTSRKVIYEAYIVSRCDEASNPETLMYVYDCKIFRSSTNSKEENDFVSSFLLVYRENVEISGPVFEMVDCGVLPRKQWVLKVKESGLLRAYAYIREVMRKVAQRNDKIVLPAEKYLDYMQEWMKYYYNYNMDTTISYFFKGVLALLENQLLAHYFSTLSLEQIRDRMYNRPIKSIEKPKNVEQFTFTEGILETQTKWQTLKITAFRLKYRVEETELRYECYRVEEPQQDSSQQDALEGEDKQIVQAFSMERKAEEEYKSLYY